MLKEQSRMRDEARHSAAKHLAKVELESKSQAQEEGKRMKSGREDCDQHQALSWNFLAAAWDDASTGRQ